jgi:hypothetical protein
LISFSPPTPRTRLSLRHDISDFHFRRRSRSRRGNIKVGVTLLGTRPSEKRYISPDMSSKTESPVIPLADSRTHASASKRSLQEKRKILAVLVLLALSFAFFCRHDTSSDYEHKQKDIFGVHPRVYTKWAMYAPWHAADRYKSPPEGCVVTQVRSHPQCLSLPPYG